MSYFEEKGVMYQEESKSIPEAERNLKRSCDACCFRGLHLECDRCAIQTAHDRMRKILMASPMPRIQIQF